MFRGLGLLSVVACFGISSLACVSTTPDQDEDEAPVSQPLGAKGGGEVKVTICHIPPGNPANAHTITVGAPAVAAHLAHGDTIGDCDEDEGEGEGGGGEPSGGGGPVCSSDGVACSAATDCCSGVCSGSGQCVSQCISADAYDGVACSESNDCCAGMACIWGLCQPGMSCVPQGAPVNPDLEFCCFMNAPAADGTCQPWVP